MTLTQSLLTIAVLIATSAFFSLAEICLAASRRLRLRQMADEGDARAERVLRLPHAEEYETLAGFLMIMLRRVPKRTDSVTGAGYTFEVIDVDSHRIDQVMVTRSAAATAGR